MIKNLHDSKGVCHQKKLMKEFPENAGAKADCHAASYLPETNPWCGSIHLLKSGAVLYSRFFDEVTDQWQGRLRASVRAK